MALYIAILSHRIFLLTLKDVQKYVILDFRDKQNRMGLWMNYAAAISTLLHKLSRSSLTQKLLIFTVLAYSFFKWLMDRILLLGSTQKTLAKLARDLSFSTAKSSQARLRISFKKCSSKIPNRESGIQTQNRYS